MDFLELQRNAWNAPVRRSRLGSPERVLQGCFAPGNGGPQSWRPLQGVVPSILVLPEIRGYGRILSAPTFGVHKPVSEWHRHRAGQGTNVLVQALCVIVRRHCRPGGFYPPLQSVCEPVPGQYRTGRVRAPTYSHRVRSGTKKTCLMQIYLL